MSFPHIKQPDSMECGATCLRMIAKFHGKEYSAETMQNLCVVTREGVSMLGIADAAEYIGFRTICGRMTLGKMVEQRPFPCILHWNQDHFVVLYDVKKKQDGKSRCYRKQNRSRWNLSSAWTARSCRTKSPRNCPPTRNCRPEPST